ncbi:hypothetical protein Y032_0001g444 [Ancylostoma ceylanicum]|uniref:JNK1/MAPK8-associated membrane protein n=1 Tax=Ancylostoma ceylanicum TaxID=53326 RepID=A0A016W646_9BILA|nr:hypothetical protein Y032_0001g444 [Ancylostoma ceylanicum]
MVSSGPLLGDAASLPPLCQGFCGRYMLPVGNDSNSEPLWSECGPCKWGSGAVDHRVCAPCESELSAYDWLFLVFMAILPLLVHCFCVHWHTPKKTSRVHELCEHLCCVFECVVASIAAILVFPPRLSFKLWGCARSNIKEWYPELYNPIINHVKPMRCSYEVVFPLYSLPFIYLLFLLCAVLIFRSFLYIVVLKRKRDAKAYYYALLSIPKVAIIHALLAGVLYQSYPYIVMLWSLGANAVHLAVEGKMSMKEIAKVVCTSPMHMAMLTVNMSLLAFALLAISVQKPLRTAIEAETSGNNKVPPKKPLRHNNHTQDKLRKSSEELASCFLHSTIAVVGAYRPKSHDRCKLCDSNGCFDPKRAFILWRFLIVLSQLHRRLSPSSQLSAAIRQLRMDQWIVFPLSL